MKAEQTNPTLPETSAGATPITEGAAPTVTESPLAEWIPSNRVIGLVLLVALLVGVWWYAAGQSRLATSKTWAELVRTGQSQSDLETLVQAGSKPARLELARLLYGPQGLGQLNPNDKDQRSKGIANIQKARDEFRELAEFYKGDKTLRVSCLVSAAEAELTLVGIPKDGTSSESLGSVEKAAELYKAAADTLGAKAPLAEQYRKRSEVLLSKKKEIEELGIAIINKLAPAPAINLGPNTSGPKAPEGGLLPSVSPEPRKEEGPKAPTTPVAPIVPPSSPLTPPTATPPSTTPATTKPTTPPTAAPTTPPTAAPVTPPTGPKK